MLKLSKSMIAVTMGDPCGIGPEVIAKALARPSVVKGRSFLVIGDFDMYRRYGGGRSKHVHFLDVRRNFLPLKFVPGKPSESSGEAALQYLKKAVELLRAGRLRALVTGPVSKELVSILNPGFHGHTEYLASAFGIAKFDMMFVAPHLKVVIVTRHVPLAKVSALITAKAVFDSIMLAHKVLRTQFKIRKPRIAVCGVNPHAGENGLMGDEEVRHVIPAVRKARKAGVTIEGPMAADTLFIGARSAGFDCVVAMYHDQGLTPIKTLYFKDVVNLTTGLPFVRTSPAHGTAFDIAGKRKADPSSMVAAIRLAAQLTR